MQLRSIRDQDDPSIGSNFSYFRLLLFIPPESPGFIPGIVRFDSDLMTILRFIESNLKPICGTMNQIRSINEMRVYGNNFLIK